MTDLREEPDRSEDPRSGTFHHAEFLQFVPGEPDRKLPIWVWGIVPALAGAAGAALEFGVGSAAAGALIYAASRPGKPIPNFYASNEEALADMKAAAAEAA